MSAPLAKDMGLTDAVGGREKLWHSAAARATSGAGRRVQG